MNLAERPVLHRDGTYSYGQRGKRSKWAPGAWEMNAEDRRRVCNHLFNHAFRRITDQDIMDAVAGIHGDSSRFRADCSEALAGNQTAWDRVAKEIVERRLGISEVKEGGGW